MYLSENTSKCTAFLPWAICTHIKTNYTDAHIIISISIIIIIITIIIVIIIIIKITQRNEDLQKFNTDGTVLEPDPELESWESWESSVAKTTEMVPGFAGVGSVSVFSCKALLST